MGHGVGTGVAAVGMLAVWLSSCATPPPAPAVPPGSASVIVVERGWHTDIGLPVDELSGPLVTLAGVSPGARFLVFGFGDRAFYRSREETLGETLAALFPGAGVMLVTTLLVSPQEAFGSEHVASLPLTRAGLAGLNAFLRHSLGGTDGDQPVRLGDGPYAGSSFYASGLTYDAFHNCNTWTVEALSAGGLPVDPDGVLFADQAMRQVRRAAVPRADAE